mgnify:CR=1 FL=1
MSPGKVVLAIATAVVLGSIVAGVLLVGGPAEGRIERLDDERVEDLQGIMRAVDRYWKDHEQLPGTLEDLAADPREQVNTIDPASAEAYDYAVLDEKTYRLCAVFDGESRSRRRAPAGFWSHASGRHCFELEVKPPADSD